MMKLLNELYKRCCPYTLKGMIAYYKYLERFDLDLDRRHYYPGVTEYDFSGIEDGTTVIDIGAGYGDFTMAAAGLGAKVTAVECDENSYRVLCRNVDRNVHQVKYVPIIYTRRFGSEVDLTYLTQFVEGNIYLKCDCEGAEWTITSNELDRVTRLEIELHYNESIVPNLELLYYIFTNFKCSISVCEVTDEGMGIMVVSGVRKELINYEN